MKFLPRDYVTTGDSVYPFFVHETSEASTLVIGMLYQYYVGTDVYKTFSVLKVNLNGEKSWFNKLTDCEQMDSFGDVSMLVDGTGATLYTVFNGAASIIYQIDISSSNTLGTITNRYINPNVGDNTGKSIPHLTIDGATLYVPYVNVDDA